MKKIFPFNQQPNSMDCRPTCLRMVVKHYSKNISLQTLREKTQIGKEGVNLLDISDSIEAIKNARVKVFVLFIGGGGVFLKYSHCVLITFNAFKTFCSSSPLKYSLLSNSDIYCCDVFILSASCFCEMSFHWRMTFRVCPQFING